MLTKWYALKWWIKLKKKSCHTFGFTRIQTVVCKHIVMIQKKMYSNWVRVKILLNYVDHFAVQWSFECLRSNCLNFQTVRWQTPSITNGKCNWFYGYLAYIVIVMFCKWQKIQRILYETLFKMSIRCPGKLLLTALC